MIAISDMEKTASMLYHDIANFESDQGIHDAIFDDRIRFACQ
jgi:hypothetical protein